MKETKRNILFVADSYFQLIIASNLRCTVYKDDDADIVLLNTSNGVENVFERISKTSFFNHYFLAKTPLLYVGKKITRKQKIEKYLTYAKSLFAPEASLNGSLPNDMSHKYDIYIFNSWGAIQSALFNYCYRRNRYVYCMRIEEGGISPLAEWHDKRNFRLGIERVMAWATGHKVIPNYVRGMYFFAPQLVQFSCNYPIIEMPKLSRNNKALVDFVTIAFDLDKLHDKYEEKFIVFEDGFIHFSSSNEDLELIKMVADKIGAENVFVKLHPRTKVNRFAPMGINTNKDVGVPWEAVLLKHDFNNKIFMSACSGATFTSVLYFEGNSRVILNYKCLKNKPFGGTDVFLNYLHDMQVLKGEDRVIIPNNREEFASIIEKIGSEIS